MLPLTDYMLTVLVWRSLGFQNQEVLIDYYGSFAGNFIQPPQKVAVREKRPTQKEQTEFDRTSCSVCSLRGFWGPQKYPCWSPLPQKDKLLWQWKKSSLPVCCRMDNIYILFTRSSSVEELHLPLLCNIRFIATGNTKKPSWFKKWRRIHAARRSDRPQWFLRDVFRFTFQVYNPNRT